MSESEDSDDPPMTPGQKRREVIVTTLVMVGVGGTIALTMLNSPMCAATVAELPLADLNRPAEVSAVLRERQRVGFGVRASTVRYSGSGYVLAEVWLLRAGQVVHHHVCRGFELEGGVGFATSATHYNSECVVTVPAGGADRIRGLARKETGSESVTFSGLSLRFYNPD